MLIRTQPVSQDARYPRLADAGFARQEYNTALAALGLLPPS
jgi:hypothetical protein